MANPYGLNVWPCRFRRKRNEVEIGSSVDGNACKVSAHRHRFVNEADWTPSRQLGVLVRRMIQRFRCFLDPQSVNASGCDEASCA